MQDNGHFEEDYSENEEHEQSTVKKYLRSLRKKTNVVNIILENYGLYKVPNIYEYSNLQLLDVSNNRLSELPDLSAFSHLSILLCHSNKLSTLPEISTLIHLKEIDCSHNELIELPENLPSTLTVLNCSNNILNYLPHILPNSLQRLNCPFNHLMGVPMLPPNLTALDCSSNRITQLPLLNRKLKRLFCANNILDSLPPLNDDLCILGCCNNKLLYLPEINESLDNLNCSGNVLSALPDLKYISKLNCSSNYITKLPDLSNNNSLHILNCSHNMLSELPPLPKGLIEIACDRNEIREIKITPNICSLFCCNNPIRRLYLPAESKLHVIICANTPLYSITGNIPPNLYISCARTPISRAIDVGPNDPPIQNTKFISNLLVLNRFVYLRALLRYRGQFNKWLWKTRQNKIEEKYSPANLKRLLSAVEDDDEAGFDEALELWTRNEL